MKPAQLPIYRAVERLMIWVFPVVERLPKSLPYQTIGGLLIRDIRECMDAVILTTQSSGRDRLAGVNILIARMTSVKTAIRVLKAMKRITPQQEVQFLDLINPISIQAGSWRAKVKQGIPKNSDNSSVASHSDAAE